MKRSLKAVFALASVGAMVLTACGGQSGDSDGEKLRIGTKFDQPGLGLKKGEELEGFDVDVATYIAKQLGYEDEQIEWVEAPSEQRETLLQNNQVDMIVATYSITDERAEVVDFAGPYFISGQDLLVREDETRIDGPQDLNGLNLCSVSGSTSAARIKEDFAEEVQLIEQPGYSECLRFLTGGEVDAVTTDDIILAGLAAEDEEAGLKVVGNPFSEERYGVGIPQGSDKCEEITSAIEEMIEDGSWAEFIEVNTQGVEYTPSGLNPPSPEGCA